MKKTLALILLAAVLPRFAMATTTGGTKLSARPDSAVDLTDDTDNRASISGNDNLKSSSGKVAFDNNPTFGTVTAANDSRFGGNSLPVYAIYEFVNPTCVNAIGIQNQVDGYNHATRSPKAFSLLAADSADAAEWTTLLSVTDESSWDNGECRYWQLENTAKYKAYKFVLSASQSDSYVIIQNLEFYGSATPTVFVSGDPADYGDIDYTETEPTVGTSVTKTAFGGAWTNAAKNISAVCTGYTLKTNGVVMATGTETSCTFTMPDTDVELIWHFTDKFYVTVNAGANGSVASVSGWYDSGAVVNAEPTGASGYGFFDWTATEGTVALNDEKFLVRGVTTLTANFAPVTDLAPGTDVISSAVNAYLASSTDPRIFRLAAGTYKETSLTNCVTLAGAVHVVGAGATPEDVIVTRGASQSARIFYLDNPRACVKNLVMSDGYGQANTQPWAGGAAYVTANGGSIVDCVVRNSGVWTYNSCGGGLYLLGGLVSRCIVSNCQTQVGYGASGGSGICAKNCVIENSLIIANKIGGSSNATTAPGGVRLEGTAQLINSTVVLNGSTTAYAGGVYLGSTTATLINTAIFGNLAATDKPASVSFATGTTGIPLNCASDDSAALNDTCIATTVPAFTSAGEPDRDYTLTVASPLRNAGSDYLATAAYSATDLAGNDRISQSGADIGAYEFQAAGLVCAFTASMTDGVTPAAAAFTATVEGATGAVKYIWDFDNDGRDDLTTTVAMVNYAYERAGTQSVKLTVTDGTSTATATQLNLFQTCQRDIFVATGGSSTSPYDSWDVATKSIADAVAIAVDGCVIHIADGDYTLSSEVKVLKAIQIVGESGDYSKVVVENNNGSRCFYVDNAAAMLANMTIHGDSEQSGRSVSIDNQGGTISNCWVKCVNGKPNGYWGQRSSALNGVRAHVTHCVFSGYGEMNTGDAGNCGCVATFSNSTIDNTIIRDTTNTFTIVSGFKGNVIGLQQGSTMVNCSIVNVVNRYSSSSSSEATCSAIYVDSTSYVTNTVIYGVTNKDGLLHNLLGTTNNLVRCATDDDTALNSSCRTITAVDFSNAANGDFRPSVKHNLFDTGITLPGQSGEIDLDGNPRLRGGNVDIGCYESQFRPGLVITGRRPTE